MTSHDIDYRIVGNDLQLVEIELDPNETVIAEAGSMVYFEEGIVFETRMGDGTQPNQSVLGKLFQAGSRLLTGESLFLTHFTNKGIKKTKVAFSAPYPGTILPVRLNELRSPLIVQKDGFLCAAMGTQLSVYFNQRFGAGLVGGEGFILQRLQGDGLAFIHAGGTIVQKTLVNQTLRIDTGCIVAFEEGMQFSVERAGNLRSMIFGGEGIFLATLSGTGRVWIQSMPVRKLIDALSPFGGNTRKENQSLLGNLFE